MEIDLEEAPFGVTVMLYIFIGVSVMSKYT